MGLIFTLGQFGYNNPRGKASISMSMLISEAQSRGNTLGVGASTFGIGSIRLQMELSRLKPRSPLKLESPNFSYGEYVNRTLMVEPPFREVSRYAPRPTAKLKTPKAFLANIGGDQ